MKILITGTTGQLGEDVLKEIIRRNYKPIIGTRENMDLTDELKIKEFIKENNPDGIIHCGAYTKVDLAEDEKTLCKLVNVESTKYIANCAKKLDIPLIYISTDYVFDGSKKGAYKEDDIPNPINTYGESKLEGEEYIRKILKKYYIVRTSWVFGKNGHNFIKTILSLSKEKKEVSIVDDQIGSPTYTKDLAPILVDMIETDKYGTYHVTNEGVCSWYELAMEISRLSNLNMSIKPIKTSQYKTKATRPLNSTLSKEKLVNNQFNILRNWKDALRDYLEDIK